MTASLEIYKSDLVTIADEELDIGDKDTGSGYVTVGTFYVKNIGDSTATSIRIGVRCMNGLYSSQDNNLGQEIVTEQLVGVKVGSGAWTAIGGDFAIDSPAGNYVTLPNLAAGVTSSAIQVRINLVAGLSTIGVTIFQGLVISFKE